MITPTLLRCEHVENPLGVDTPRPRLSWVLQPGDPGERGWRQTAYQVIVSAAQRQLWNSQKVTSAACFGIEYGGPQLKAAQKLVWKVRIWDASDRPSPWSESTTWTMGLPSPENWQARWISSNRDAASKDPLPLFRRSFQLDQPVTRALVFICGLGQHELRLNGRKVDDDVLSPGWTNYRKTCHYTVHDVTALLTGGENVLGVMLGNGMYNVTGGRYAKFKASFGPPKLICQLRLDHADGTVVTIASDSTWRTAPGPITFSCIFGGEDHDARLEQSSWDRPGFDDSSWKPATQTESPGGMLVAQAEPPIRVVNVLKPVQFTRPLPDTQVYDLGQNVSGVPSVTAAATAGTTITMRTGELLDENGVVTQKNTGSPVSFSYTQREQGVETWHPRFSYTGFRYVQIDGPPPMDLEARFIHADARRVGRFSCSQPLFNRIHDLILAAIDCNLQSLLTDCPHREKLAWLEQHHLMAPSIMFNYDVATFYEKTARDIRDAQRDDGCVPTIAPEYVVFEGKWADFSNSPEWGSAVILSPWQVYRHYGDVRILRENYDAMVRYADYLHRREVDGIIDFGLGDWYDIGEADPGFSKLTSKALTATAIYFHDLTTLQQIAAVLDRRDDAERFHALARCAREAFNARFFDPSRHQYDSGSQTAQAIPLALGMVDARLCEGVLERLIRDIRRHDNHITAGDVGFRFVLAALADAGRSDVVVDLLARTDPPSYGSQLERGATTLTEAWDANPSKSQNHLMLGHAEAWFWESLAGMRIDLSQLDARRIVFRPALVAEITWVAATHETVLGTLAVRWERQGGRRIKISLSTPVRSTVVLPVSDANAIHEGRKLVQHAPGVQGVRVAQEMTHVEIESGEYNFEIML